MLISTLRGEMLNLLDHPSKIGSAIVQPVEAMVDMLLQGFHHDILATLF